MHLPAMKEKCSTEKLGEMYKGKNHFSQVLKVTREPTDNQDEPREKEFWNKDI